MNYIRDRVLRREFLSGTWCNLGSSITAEIAGNAGFDWVLLDHEHGTGGDDALVYQLQGVGCTPAAPIVRIAWNDPVRMKRVLDLGAAGVMVPWVNNADEAKRAVAGMRYPPAGMRGVARATRAVAFGRDVEPYFREANDKLLTVVQIETEEALANVEAIAAVDGADVLFVGPVDLSTNMGIQLQFEHPRFKDALRRVSDAARGAGKAAGILLATAAQIEGVAGAGFTFVALSSDGSMVWAGMRAVADALGAFKRR